MICRNNSIVKPYEKRARAPQTVTEAIAAFERKYQSPATLSQEKRVLLQTLRRTCKPISALFGIPPDMIYLDELVGIDKFFFEFMVSRGKTRQTACQSCCDLHKLLDIAHDECGWTTKSYEVRESWRPIRAALRGRGHGHKSIIEFAIAGGCSPKAFTKEMMDAWKQDGLGRGRPLDVVQNAERAFRTVLRRAAMQSYFPNFRLDAMIPSKYCLRLIDRDTGMELPDIPEPLRTEILEAVRWKTADEDLDDRDEDLLIREVTGKNMVKYFLQLYSFAVNILKKNNIDHLSLLLVEEVVCGFVEFLQKDNRCKSRSVRCKLSSIHHLAHTYPKLKNTDYSWFSKKLNTLRKETHSQTQARKLATMPTYQSISRIASQLLALQKSSSGLSEVEAGWLTRDCLLFVSALYAPHRSRNIREAAYDPEAQLNVFETEITSELLSEMNPAWAKEIRDADPRTPIFVYHALEKDAKAGQEIWEPWPQEAVPLLKEWIQHYRPLLLRSCKSDVTTLLFTRNGKPFTEQSLLRLVSNISTRFGSRLRVKDFRDIVGAQLLGAGADVEDAAARLWHLPPYTTTIQFYTGGFNTSDSVAPLEDELAELLK